MIASGAFLPTLSTHRVWRLFALFMLYTAQGVPEGLLYIAVPAWLAAKGVAPEAIGGYIAIILLPWSLKLINGLIMDRVAYLPMGRRRPWVIGAQGALVLTLIVFGARVPDGEALTFLIVTGFLVNLSAAFQDVAIDGMAIDVVPEEERARANGVMWGGKTLGIAGAAFVTGSVINAYGFARAALVTAAVVALIMVVPIVLRERPGERLMPWTAGAPAPDAAARQLHAWAPLAMRLLRALMPLGSLLFAAGIFVAFTGYGLEQAYAPVLAVQTLDWTDEGYSRLASLANLAGGVFGVGVAGVLADRFGALRTLMVTLLAMAVLQGAMAGAPGAWAEIFAVFKVTYLMLFVLMSVSLYAAAMALCVPAVAATQFSVYMAVLNFGTAFGAQRFGAIEAASGYGGVLMTAGGVCFAGAGLFLLAGRFAGERPLRADPG
ncbi:MAG: MFS transporter [Alphaproteobacteria bacterium]